jgi:hypothetical protein
MVAPAARRWFCVEAPTFCCLVAVEGDAVVEAAPVLRWLLVRRNRSLAWLEDYARRRRWLLEELDAGGSGPLDGPARR